MCASRGMLPPPTCIRWCFAEPAGGTAYAKACGQSGHVSNFAQILLFEFEETGWFETLKPAPKCFDSTLKIFADRVSSNRTEHASGEGNVHAFSICVAQVQAADPPADKPVLDMRRGDHSCRD